MKRCREGHRCRHLILSSTLLALCLSILMSCDPLVVYHHYEPLTDSQWKDVDTLTFTPQLLDSEVTYQVDLEIRMLHSYPYQDINIGYRYLSPAKEIVQAGSCQLNLTDTYADKNGSGIAGLYAYPTVLKKLYVGKAGDYTIQVFQEQKDSVLKGIQDLGIKLSRIH